MEKYDVFKSECGYRVAKNVYLGGPVMDTSIWYKTKRQALNAARRLKSIDPDYIKTVRINIWGGFHETTNYIEMRVDERAISEYGIDTTYLTPYQIKRANKHLCGYSDCLCGGIGGHNIKWKEI